MTGFVFAGLAVFFLRKDMAAPYLQNYARGRRWQRREPPPKGYEQGMNIADVQAAHVREIDADLAAASPEMLRLYRQKQAQ